jgi:sulfite reductase beta subunit-like hemoprotein
MLSARSATESMGADVRLTRQQNFVLGNVPEAAVDRVVAELGAIGFPLDANPVRASSIACTGEPHCNFSVTETKTRLDSLIGRLEARFGDAIADLRLHLDGCPHACAQHWVGDIGFQGTTVRDEGGRRQQAYDVFLRGGLGPRAAIARPIFRRVPSDELDEAVVGLVTGWLDRRQGGESFRDFCDRTDDARLAALAGREAARAKEAA